MAQKNTGVPALPSGHQPSASEPSGSSQSGVPNAGDWAVLRNWRYRVVQIERVTEQCVWVADEPGVRARRTWREKLISWGPDKAAMERVAAQLTSAAAEMARREAAARIWFAKEVRRITASGIAARSDETPQEVRPVGQEPDPKGDAQ